MKTTRLLQLPFVVAFTLAIVLAGCGGGGGSGGSAGGGTGGSGGTGGGGTGGGMVPGGGANVTSTYLFYTNSDNSFNAIDPAAPGTVIPVVAASATAATQDLTQVEEGSFASTGTGAPGSNTVSDLHTDSWVYVNANTNVLNKVSALKGALPTPVQLSGTSFGAAGTAAAYCPKSLQVFPDYQTIANSLVIFSTAGTDGTCGSTDDDVLYTTLGASATTSPTAITPPSPTALVTVLKPIYNLSTGAISGALVQNGTSLVKTDATLNLTTATTVASGLLGYQAAVEATNAKGQMLLTYNFYLYAYDPSQPVSATNPKQLGTTQFPWPNMPLVNDGTNAFFVGNLVGINYVTIYRVPMDGSAAPTAVYTAPSTETLYDPYQQGTLSSIMLTTNRVVFAWYDSTVPVYGIGSVLKSATGATTATAINPTVLNAIWSLHSVAGTGVNFNGGLVAYHASEDGTGLSTPQVANQVLGRWDGRIRPTTMALDQYDGSSSLRAVMFAQTLDLATSTNGNALAAYDVASGTQTADLGALPPSTIASGEYLANNYCSLFVLSSIPNSQGVFLNTNASNSVSLLPNPSMLNQSLVGENGH